MTSPYTDVNPVVSDHGGRVGVVEWQGRPDRTYQVQLWYDTATTPRQNTVQRTNLYPRAQSILAASGMDVNVLQHRSQSLQSRVATVLEISDRLTCSTDSNCLYHFPDLDNTGRYTLEVLDVTEPLVHSTRIEDHTLLPWGGQSYTSLPKVCENSACVQTDNLPPLHPNHPTKRPIIIIQTD